MNILSVSLTIAFNTSTVNRIVCTQFKKKMFGVTQEVGPKVKGTIQCKQHDVNLLRTDYPKQ